jgi:hypothetical protein
MKIAIVCGAPSSEFLAPFDNKEWAIWVLGNRLHHYKEKHVDCIFEIHDNLLEHGDPVKYALYLENEARKRGCGLVVGEKFPTYGLPLDYYALPLNCTKFDYEASEKIFGSLYLTSSPAYMMSHAMLIDGLTDIGLYGVDLSIDDHEYFWQRPCIEAWIGFAKGRGINIHIPDISHVGKCDYVEGRDWNGIKNEYGTTGGIFSQREFDKMVESHAQKIELIDQHISQLVADKHTHNGARQAYERLSKVARAKEAKFNVKSMSETVIIK